MPFYICPRCKTRRVDHDGREGLSQEPPSCHHCDFGFMFQLLEDYYPAQATGFVVCDQEGRILATGHGIFELTGYEEPDLMGRDVVEAFHLSDPKVIETVREWGVRQLGKEETVTTHAGLQKKVTADFFPAYDEDGGMLVALTPEFDA
jgi:PAS domain S-box-containing protein